MSVKSEKSRVVYMEEEDEQGNLNNRVFATSNAGSPRSGGAKMNTGKKKSSPKDRQPEYQEPPPKPIDSDDSPPPSRRESKSSRQPRHREPDRKSVV